MRPIIEFCLSNLASGSHDAMEELEKTRIWILLNTVASTIAAHVHSTISLSLMASI